MDTYTGTTKQAVEAISAAERKLREFVAIAAGNGDYNAAAQIMEWAKELAQLAAEPRPTVTSLSDAVVRTPRTVGGESRRKPPKGEFPRFFRRGDNLVKIGWSKTERKEYEHKAPRRIVDALAESIARRSNNGKVFTAEGLFPVKDPQDGSDVPEYQSYVALAWFKSVGFVEQHGRRGYTTKLGSRFLNAVKDAWLTIDDSAIQRPVWSHGITKRA